MEFPRKGSAEGFYKIDASDQLMRATKFASNPQEYIDQYHNYLREQGVSEAKLVAKLIIEIFTLEKILIEEAFPATNEALEIFLSEPEYSPEGMRVLFTWLKQAGLRYDDIKVWVDIEDDELTHEQRLEARSMGVILNQVFDK
jgi:hypothetical protein